MTSTKTKHTPGPWRIDPEYEFDIQGANGTVEVAVIIDDAPSWKVPGPDFDTAAANARLIAAEPELLEALKRAERDLVHLLDRDGRGESVNDPTLEIVRAAIAKAEGK